MNFIQRLSGLNLGDMVRSIRGVFRELGLHSTTTRPRVRPRERWRDYVSLLAFEGLTTPPHTHTHTRRAGGGGGWGGRGLGIYDLDPVKYQKKNKWMDFNISQ